MNNQAELVLDSTPPPAKPAASLAGRYLYAVVDGTSADATRGLSGIAGGAVYRLHAGQLAAVVSNVPNQRIRPERANLAAHQGVLRQLLERTTVLPLAFGTIAEGDDAIRKILFDGQAAFAEQLARVEGKVEMGLRVAWDVPNIFEFFVNTHAELRERRDELFQGGREPSQDDLIDLGRRFDQALSEDRAAHTDLVAGILDPACAEIKPSKPRTEREVMNLACLVRRDALPAFEQAVFEAAKLFDNSYAFDYNGPWPPFNFVGGGP